MIGRVVGAVVVLLLGLLAFALWRAEWVREQTDSGYNWKAQGDDSLAARRFLENRGLATRALEAHGLGLELPPTGSALVFLAPRLTLSESASASLDAWIRRGGQLVTLPSPSAEEMLYGRKDALMRAMGIAVVDPPAPDAKAKAESPAVGEDVRDDAHSDVTYDNNGCVIDPVQRVTLPGTGESLAVSMATSTHMVSPPLQRRRAPSAPVAPAGEALLADGDGMLLYTAPYGRGRVTFIADGGLWMNDEVGCLDHAHLLWRVLGPARVAWFVTEAERATLGDLILRHGKPMLAAAGALLLLWLWRVSQRLGPLLPSPQPLRRERMESLRAAGEYLWRQRAITDLLAGARARVRNATRRRFGHEEALAAQARRAQIAPERAQAAMAASPTRERDLIATTRTLQELIDPP